MHIHTHEIIAVTDSFSTHSLHNHHNTSVVCCVIRGLRDPQTPVVPPAVREISDGTGNTEREGGREASGAAAEQHSAWAEELHGTQRHICFIQALILL